MTEMSPQLPEPEILVLLAQRRRRQLLRILQETTTPLTSRDLAARLAKSVFESPTDSDERYVHISLHHNHLPRLDDADVIVYKPEEGIVAPGTNFDCLIRVLDGVTDRERPWSDR